MMKWLVVLAGVSVACYAADWAQFCGPERNNLSKETGLLKAWPDDGPAVLWETDVTTGYAGPAIKNGKVYQLEHDGEESSLRCLDLASGEELWTCSFSDPGEIKSKKYPGSRGTPTVMDDRLYAITLMGTVVCVNLENHKVEWQKNLVEDYGKKIEQFGIAQQPLVVGDLVVLAPLAERVSVIALNRLTGKKVWSSNVFPGGSGFVSPNVVRLAGVDQIVMVSGGSKPEKKGRGRKKSADDDDDDGESENKRATYVFSLSPKEGSLLWSYDGWSCQNPIPHPIPVGEDRLFVTSGYNAGSVVLKIEKEGGGFSVKKEMETKASTQIEQPIFYDGYIYIGSDGKSSKDGLCCIDLDGNILWNSKDADAPRFEHVNMIIADGMIIGLDSKSGVLHLIEASPKKYTELASAQVVKEKDQAWAPIALSDGKLLVRDHSTMKCLKLK